MREQFRFMWRSSNGKLAHIDSDWYKYNMYFKSQIPTILQEIEEDHPHLKGKLVVLKQCWKVVK